ncbi:MAG: AAA family ATPase [Bradymonadaceae bacterium]|nr:AAA family ATPase [Lujinxingiaceae bacterium]
MNSQTPSLKLPRIATGIERLDAIFDGGFPAQSVNVIAGEPGAGKTVLILQTVFEAARQGKKCIYFTTLSEPAVKLIRFMQLFEFFDAALLQEHIVLADLGSVLRTQGAEAALAMLTARVEEHDPELVVVDSFKAIQDRVEPERRRTFVYDLAVTMTSWGATTLLIGEYTESEIITLPEFAIADGIVQLRAARSDLNTIRELEVRKLRGSSFVTGTHFFDIVAAGIDFVPRVRAPDLSLSPPSNSNTSTPTRSSTGTPGLDSILRGGWPANSATVVVGGTGTGKTILGLKFLVEGARLGQPGVFLALEEAPDQLRATARGFGWDLEALEKAGLLVIYHIPPIEISTDRFLLEARAVVEASGARRVVLDSLTSLALGAISDKRFMELIYALTKHLRRAGVTSQMNLEVSELLGTGQISGHGLSFAVDNVLYIRYVEARGRLNRAMTVIKARGIEHATELYEMTITKDGVQIGRALSDLQGVLTGLPSPFKPDQ